MGLFGSSLELSRHVRMCAAMVIDCAGFPQRNAAALADWKIHIPRAVAGRCGVSDEVLVGPLDDVAHLRFHRSGHEGDPAHIDMDDGCVCTRRRHQNARRQCRREGSQPRPAI